MRAHSKITLGIVAGSLGLHVVAWAIVGTIRGERRHDLVAISLAEKKKEEKEKPKPPPPVVEPKHEALRARAAAPKPAPKSEPAPKAEAPKPAAMSSFADLGLGPMTGGTGGGLPVGGGGGGGPSATPAPTSEPAHRHVALVPAEDACSEDLIKPKLSHQVQPEYTPEGRQANVEGAVQLEIVVDATGHVVSVRVLHGLGFGLDQAAIAAARQWTFEPATRCGKPVPTTVKGKVRFTLS